MPSNSEMYERGALDATHDDLNLFYYQHYYYYRKGYDETRRQLRHSPLEGGLPAPRRWLIVALLAAVVLLGGSLAYWWLGPLPALWPVTAAAPTAAPLPIARPTLRPTVTPAAVPTATAVPQMVVGARARVVNLNGSPLRLREAPGRNARLVTRIPEGGEVTLLEGPVEADGFIWWRVQAAELAGWCAERGPEGPPFLIPIPHPAG